MWTSTRSKQLRTGSRRLVQQLGATRSASAAANTETRIRDELLALADPASADRHARFFERPYYASNAFLGISVPRLRATVRSNIRETTRAEVLALLHDRRHEMRVAGGMCLVEAFTTPRKSAMWLQDSSEGEAEGGSEVATRATPDELKQRVVDLYLANLASFDNWDLVDLTSYKILGAWMAQNPSHVTSMERFCALLASEASGAAPVDVDAELAQLVSAMRVLPTWYQKLLASTDFWETRVSIVLVYGLRKQNVAFALHICRYQILRLLDQENYVQRVKGKRFEDYNLVHRACGWMLRESGRADRDALLRFLERYAPFTPRLSLQYATEHLEPAAAKAIRSQGTTKKRTKTTTVAKKKASGVKRAAE